MLGVAATCSSSNTQGGYPRPGDMAAALLFAGSSSICSQANLHSDIRQLDNDVGQKQTTFF